MSTDREITRIVRSWLEEGVTALPDRVLDTVLDQVPATPQRRSWWPPRRFPQMNRFAQAAIAAAAVLVVAVVGYNLLPRSGGPGGTPTASPTPVPTAAPTPTPTQAPESTPALPLTGAWEWSGGRVTFAIPAGWSSFGDHIAVHESQPGEVNLGHSLPGSRYEVTHVYTDGCRSEGALAAVGPTVEDLAAALDAQLGSDAVVTDFVSLGGFPGTRVDLTITPGLDTTTCRYGTGGPLQVWADLAETGFFALPPGASGRVYIVDVGGDRVVLQSSSSAEASAADIADLDAVISTIAFEPSS